MGRAPAVCRKTGFASEAEALRRLIEVALKGTSAIKPIRTYQCPRCGRWHLTKSPHHNPEGN